MKRLSVITKRLNLAVRTVACASVMAVLTIVGCAEKAVEPAPVDVEQERQEHIKMIQRETGQAPAPEPK